MCLPSVTQKLRDMGGVAGDPLAVEGVEDGAPKPPVTSPSVGVGAVGAPRESFSFVAAPLAGEEEEEVERDRGHGGVKRATAVTSRAIDRRTTWRAEERSV